jgi:hypothetical protein
MHNLSHKTGSVLSGKIIKLNYQSIKCSKMKLKERILIIHNDKYIYIYIN